MKLLERVVNFLRWLWSLNRYSYTYRIIRFIRHLWRERLTRPGQFVLAAAVTSVIAACFPDIMVGSYTFSAFAALAMLSITLTLVRRPKLQVVRSVAERCVAGSPIPIRITVCNQGRKPVFDIGAYEYRLPPLLKLAQEPQYISSIAPGADHTFEFKMTAARRGSYALPGASVLSAFPFGLAQGRKFVPDPRRLIVYPSFRPLVSLEMPTGQRYQPGGIVLTSNVGESMEFIGNREYRPGDRLRDLHPRSWARVGYPVVRQFQEEFLTRIAILVDTYVPSPAPLLRGRIPRPDDPLEATLSLTAAISDYIARQEYIVDLFAAGPELYHFQAGRSLGFLDNILDILACIERSPADPLDSIGAKFNEELGQISTVIVLLLSWEPKRQMLIERIRRSGVQVKPILISNRLTAADFVGAGRGASVVTPKQIARGLEKL